MKIIEKLKELVANATEGPFIYKDCAIHSLSAKAPRILNGDPIDIMEDGEESDWELFAISRNTFPALLKIAEGITQNPRLLYAPLQLVCDRQPVIRCRECKVGANYPHKPKCRVALIEEGIRGLEELEGAGE